MRANPSYRGSPPLACTLLSTFLATLAWQAAVGAAAEAVPGKAVTDGWKPHAIKQGDGKGGWTSRPAESCLLRMPSGKYIMAFGLAQLPNREVLLLGAWHDGEKGVPDGDAEKTVAAFSKDGGRTWGEFRRILDLRGRPMMLASLGGGTVTFQTNKRFFSHDYGRTWPESVPVQMPRGGSMWGVEGNPLVEYDAQGKATDMAEIGYFEEAGKPWPEATIGVFRRSSDGGRTWTDVVTPTEWSYQETHAGKSCTRGTSEGSLVRAANGWLVAVLRTDIRTQYLSGPFSDNLEGTAVSISKDEGKTWSPMQILYDAGRMHAHLLRLPNDDLVMTLILRLDMRDGKLASHRHGCEAIVSHDNGLTWDLAHKYVLDDFEAYDANQWYIGPCGHLYSALLNDGFILTAYNNYPTKGVTLIRWRPN